MSRTRKVGGASVPTNEPDAKRLNRGFSVRSAFALTVADVSPIVALFTIFTLGIFAAGPAFFWAFPIVLIGQLAVAAVFGEMASRWPYAGSVYQWARHVRGTTWGWIAAWAYMWGLTIALSTLAYGAAGFLLDVFGAEDVGRGTTTVLALVIVAVGSIANIVGRRMLKILVVLSIICELLGSIGLATVLLLFFRENSPSVLFDGFGTQGAGSWLGGPMLIAIAYVGWSFVGFEAAGSIAEEVEKPERNVPKAMLLSLLCVGGVVMYSSAAVVLAIPDLDRVMAEQSGDPVSDTLVAHLGSGVGRPLLIMFVIGFLSSFLAVQAAVSRCVWGSARDGSLPGSGILDRLTGPERLPGYATALTGAVAAVLVLLSGSELYGILVNFTTIGFYIAFGVPVLGAAVARFRGEWIPGAFSLGRWGAPVTYFASLWVILQTLNIIWPRESEGTPWYITWSMVLATAGLGIVGVVVYLTRRTRIRDPIGLRLENAESRRTETEK